MRLIFYSNNQALEVLANSLGETAFLTDNAQLIHQLSTDDQKNASIIFVDLDTIKNAESIAVNISKSSNLHRVIFVSHNLKVLKDYQKKNIVDGHILGPLSLEIINNVLNDIELTNHLTKQDSSGVLDDLTLTNLSAPPKVAENDSTLTYMLPKNSSSSKALKDKEEKTSSDTDIGLDIELGEDNKSEETKEEELSSLIDLEEEMTTSSNSEDGLNIELGDDNKSEETKEEELSSLIDLEEEMTTSSNSEDELNIELGDDNKSEETKEEELPNLVDLEEKEETASTNIEDGLDIELGDDNKSEET